MADFPDGFLWGSGTAAHQVEGGNVNNDWWAWEHDNGSPTVEPSVDANDHYHRYAEDFALLASLGQNAHRFSLEWSRIEPAPGEFSQAALDHYARVLDCLAGNDLTAFATMHHFTVPRWFAERGGWLAPDGVELFGRFVERVSAALGDRIPYACTINEPQIVSLMAYGLGRFPPGEQDISKAFAANAALMQAHRTATAALRAGKGSPKIGTCLQLPVVEPLDPANEADVAKADGLRLLLVDSHLADLRAGGDVGDWVGLQYYTRLRIDAAAPSSVAPPPEGAETTGIGWEVYPEGFGTSLRALAEVGLPIVVTENGIATTDDTQRIRFLHAHLSELQRVMADGVDVRGYLHWTSFDNFEWVHGYHPTFGLIGIDRDDDLRRVVRPSAEVYGEVARTNSLKALTEALA
jgi:beta-glucosidase